MGVLVTEMQETAERHAARADLYLSFSRALLPPQGAAARAFAEDLAEDLSDIAAVLDVPVGPGVQQFRDAARHWRDEGALLVHYSRQFLTPPFVAPLNASLYLDGAVMGNAALLMEECYRRHGVGRAETFRDLPDHLALALEFVAHLFASAAEGAPEAATAAGDFLAHYVVSWLPELISNLAPGSDQGAPCPYHRLARLLLAFAAADATRFATPAEPEPAPRRRARREAVVGDDATAAKCKSCGTPFVRDKALRKMAQAMAAKGLSAAHLDTCPACRNLSLGVTPMPPPTLRRQARRKRHDAV